MHLIVMTAAAQGGAAPESPQDSPWEALLERWGPLMTRLVPVWNLKEDDEALNTLAERAQARLVWNRPLSAEDDGRLPLQAWSLGDTSGAAWARLSPFHGVVGADRITLMPPSELRLGEAESRALFDSICPLFDSESVQLHWHGPLHWRLGHESLRGLPCASRLRAEGDSVQRWQGRTPLSASRLLRRLQNEAQMVLHGHPVNEGREARGEPAVNSLWLDHAGSATDGLAQALDQPVVLPWIQANAAVQAWVDAALPPPPAGQPEPILVLCGRHAAQAFTMRRLPAGWRGALARTLFPPPRTRPLAQWLQRVDEAQAGEQP
jgi:hypothetical protein